MPINPMHTRVGLAWLILTVLVCSIFARLGLWQLSRAAEKAMMLDQARSAGAAQVSFNTNNIDVARDLYHRFNLQGVFLSEKQFLLDNRIRDGRVGFEVITPFEFDADGGHVLVNRGWIAAGPSRSELPAISLSDERSESLVALLARPSKGFALGTALQDGDSQWPRLLQFVDYQSITAALGLTLKFDVVFVAEADQPGVLEFNFQPVASGPEKHYAYAFQWFLMLIALLIIYIYLTFLKRND